MFAKMSRVVISMCCLCLLTGCGGGDSNNNGRAQGVYQGTAGTAPDIVDFLSIVLPDDTLYGLYGSVVGGNFLISGFITGQGTSRGSSFTATVNDFFLSGAGTPATLSAVFIPGSSFNGSLTENGETAAFTGTPIPSSVYNYNRTASVSEISGNWTGDMLDGTSASVSISSTGALSGVNAGCSFTGSMTPDSSGKNFFRLNITFANSGSCLLPGQSGSGIAVTYLISGTSMRQLVIAGTAGGMGTVFAAIR